MKIMLLCQLCVLVSLLASLTGCGTSKAVRLQKFESGLREIEWNYYKIRFKIPADFTLLINDQTQFTGTTGDIALSIKPFKDASISEPHKIAQIALDGAPGTNKTESKNGLTNLPGLNGYFTNASATYEDKPIHLLVAGFMNPQNATRFTVQYLFYSQNKSIDDQKKDYCETMLNTFKSILDTNSMALMLDMMSGILPQFYAEQWEVTRTEIDLLHASQNAQSFRELDQNVTYAIVAFADPRVIDMKLSVYQGTGDDWSFIGESNTLAEGNLRVVTITPTTSGNFSFVLTPLQFLGDYQGAHYGILIFYKNDTGTKGTTEGIYTLLTIVRAAVPSVEVKNEIVRIEIDNIGTQKTSYRNLQQQFTYGICAFSNIDISNFQFGIYRLTGTGAIASVKLPEPPLVQNGVLCTSYQPTIDANYLFSLVSDDIVQSSDNYYGIIISHELPQGN